MKENNTEGIRAKVLGLIESEFDSDAAFERAMSLPEKTVNNWRRCRSASFMRMLPALSELFKVNISELMDIPLTGGDTSVLSEEEIHLLHLYRRARFLPSPMRSALRRTLESSIELYIESYQEVKSRQRNKK